MFLTHTNDPHNCYVIGNKKILWYEKNGERIFSNKTMKAVEEE